MHGSVGSYQGSCKKPVGTNLLNPSPHHLTPPPFLWPEICLSKVWLPVNYLKVPTKPNYTVHVKLLHN